MASFSKPEPLVCVRDPLYIWVQICHFLGLELLNFNVTMQEKTSCFAAGCPKKEAACTADISLARWNCAPDFFARAIGHHRPSTPLDLFWVLFAQNFLWRQTAFLGGPLSFDLRAAFGKIIKPRAEIWRFKGIHTGRVTRYRLLKRI